MAKNAILAVLVVLVVVLIYQVTAVAPGVGDLPATADTQATTTPATTLKATAPVPKPAAKATTIQKTVSEAVISPKEATQASMPLRAKDGAYLISYTDSGFYPATVEIERGQSVRWTNNSSKGLRVITTDLVDHQPTNEMNAPKTIARGETYSFTFNKPYVYGYTNQNNTKDKAVVIVNEQ